MASETKVIIKGEDQASKVFKNVGNALGDFGTKAAAVSFAFNQVTSAIGQVVSAIKPLIDAAITMEKIDSTMRVAAGSSEAAAQELAFVRQEAQRLGLSFVDVAQSYAKFAVASKGTALEGEQTRKVFSSIATASAALRLSTDETNGALTAVQQMMSKGTVSSEELRGQLGERLPGAFNLAAKAMGVTTAQLGKMLEQGQISAADMLPKLAAELEKTFGGEAAKGADSLQGSINKLNTTLKETAGSLGTTFGPAVKWVLGWVEKLAKASVNLFSLLEALGIGLGVAMARVAVRLEGLFSGDYLTDSGKKAIRAKLDAINEGAQQEIAALEKKYSTLLGKENQLNEKAVDNSEKAGKLRRESAKKTGSDLVKIESEYAKEMGTTQQKLTAEYDKNYEDRKKALTAYYDSLKSQAGSNREEEQYEKMKKARLLELEKQHAQDINIVKARTYADAIAARQSAVDDEIASINMAAAKKQITTQEAERRITALTVASLQDQYQARKNAADMAASIYGKDSAEYQARLKEMEGAHKSYVSANLAAYKKYSDEIKAIDQQIKDYRQSIQDKIRDIQQKGMTDGQKYADDQKRYDEAVSASRAALAVKDYDTATKYAKQAEELAGRLVDKKAESNTKLQELEKQHQQRLADIAKQSTGNQTEQQRQSSEVIKETADYEKQRIAILAEQKAATDGITNATQALTAVEQLRVQIMEAQKKEIVDARSELEKIRDLKLEPKNVVVNMDQGALASVKSEIDALTKDATKTIYIKTVGASGEASYSNTSGGATGGYFAGGKVTNGSPLRDSVNAMLARDEWVINNKAAGFWGDNLLAAINAPLSSSGRRLQETLRSVPSPTQPNVTPMGTINLDIGGGSFPMSAPIDVLSELQTALRRRKMTRPNL